MCALVRNGVSLPIQRSHCSNHQQRFEPASLLGSADSSIPYSLLPILLLSTTPRFCLEVWKFIVLFYIIDWGEPSLGLEVFSMFFYICKINIFFFFINSMEIIFRIRMINLRDVNSCMHSECQQQETYIILHKTTHLMLFLCS